MTLNCLLTRSQSACETFGYGSTSSSPFAWPLPSPIETGTRSMYTRRKRCLPIFHSTSTTSSPSERATLSAASRIFSNCKQRLPDLSRFNARCIRPNKKVGLRPPRRATRYRAKGKYMPSARQKQGTGWAGKSHPVNRNRVPSGTSKRDAKKVLNAGLWFWRRGAGSRLWRGRSSRPAGSGLGSGGGWLCRIGLIVKLNDVGSDVDAVRSIDRSALRRRVKNRDEGVFSGVTVEHVHHFAPDAVDDFLLRSVDVFLIIFLLAC